MVKYKRGLFRVKKSEFIVLKFLRSWPGLNISKSYLKIGIPIYILRFWMDDFLKRGFLKHELKKYSNHYFLNDKGLKYYQKRLKELKKHE